jgi:hypothetical protein
MVKLKTIDNPLAYCVIGLMNQPEEPTFEGVKEDLVDVMLQQECEETLDKGVCDGLLKYLGALANLNEVFLNAREAEQAMIEAYIVGQAIAFDIKKLKGIRENVEGGNSGWNWPVALSYKKGAEIYPLPLCEQYGLMLGYKHGRESIAMAEYFKSEQGKRRVAEIEAAKKQSTVTT